MEAKRRKGNEATRSWLLRDVAPQSCTTTTWPRIPSSSNTAGASIHEMSTREFFWLKGEEQHALVKAKGRAVPVR